MLRFKLIVGKYRVVRLYEDFGVKRMVVDMGNDLKLVADLPRDADVREGDVVTLYTEVPVKETVH